MLPTYDSRFALRVWSRLPALLFVICAFSLSHAAHAQLRAGTQQPDHIADASVGWSSALTLRLGYQAPLRRFSPSKRIRLGAEVEIPISLIPTSLDGGRVGGNLSALWFAVGSFAVETTGRLNILWGDSEMGSQIGLGAEFILRPGYFAERWAAMAELSWGTSIASYFDHSSQVEGLYGERYDRIGGETEDTVDGPQDGVAWFAMNRFRVGGGFSALLSDNVTFLFRGGLDFVPQRQGIIGFPPVTPLPFYVEIGGGYQW